MTDNIHPIIRKLRDIRIGSKLSQEDVANIFGGHQNQLSKYELGRHDPTLKLLSNWAGSLGYEVTIQIKDGK